MTGEDKTVEVVVDIFNRVNSGGTKLSKGDLALARICARWPDARTEMQRRLAKWSAQGFHFKLEWLLRCVNTVLTGEALFSALADVGTPEFRDGLKRAEACVDVTLNMLSSRLGIDHDRVLGSRYSFPLIAYWPPRRPPTRSQGAGPAPILHATHSSGVACRLHRDHAEPGPRAHS